MSLQEDRARERLYEAVQEYQQTDLTLRRVVGLLCTEWSPDDVRVGLDFIVDDLVIRERRPFETKNHRLGGLDLGKR